SGAGEASQNHGCLTGISPGANRAATERCGPFAAVDPHGKHAIKSLLLIPSPSDCHPERSRRTSPTRVIYSAIERSLDFARDDIARHTVLTHRLPLCALPIRI